MPNTSSLLVLICVIALIVLTTLIVIASRYRKCPSDKVMVIYGKVGSNADGTSTKREMHPRRRGVHLAGHPVGTSSLT